MKSPEYRSNRSVASSKLTPIGADDPKLDWKNLGLTKRILGNNIDYLGLDGKMIIAGGTTLNVPDSSSIATPQSGPADKVFLPPNNGQPGSFYPGFDIVPVAPQNVTAEWDGVNLVITFTWDSSNPLNQTVSNFIVEMGIDGTTRKTSLDMFVPNKSQTTQTLILTKELNSKTFGKFRTAITSICVLAIDPFYNVSSSVCVADVPLYNSTLPTPQITISSVISGYSIAYTPPAVEDYEAIEILEYESSITPEPVGATYSRVYLGTISPAVISTANTNSRWVKARYVGASGEDFSNFTVAELVTPINPVSIDNTPPNEVSSVTGVWNSDDITINYVLPGKSATITNVSASAGTITYTATNTFVAGETITITGVNPTAYNLTNVTVASASSTNFTVTNAATGSYVSGGSAFLLNDAAARVQIQLTAPNTLVGYFYRFPSTTSRSQTTIITKKDLFDQFGEHYSSFSGVLRSIDSADNKSAGVSFTVGSRPNPLLGITPEFTLVPLSNAYSVNFTLPTGATKAEVYAKHEAWSGDPVDDTYVVYSGLSPAVITDTDYTPVYIKIRYYDDFNNTSNYSTEGITTPLDPGLITSFENPISFGQDAVIYAGDSYNSGKRVTFKADGIFAYDSGGSSTTQIVSNAADGTPTFITTQAQIADWKISTDKIENTLNLIQTTATGTSGQTTITVASNTDIANNQYVFGTGIGTGAKVTNVNGTTITLSVANSGAVSGTVSFKTNLYTGLAASGTYAFWAGSSVSGGNSSAKFTVTPQGAVTAREISIIGNGGTEDLITAGGLFTVKNNGTVTATSATITGAITASSGSITGNLSIGTSGSLTSGVVGQLTGNSGYILNNEGLRFDYGTTQSITLINGTTGKLTTKSANIGNWEVDENKIYKTSSGGRGNISLDSSKGYIYVSDATTPSYTAGINSSSSANSVVFWAGDATQDISGVTYPDPGKNTDGVYSNGFVVRMDGKMYAKGVEIDGKIKATDGYIGSADNHWIINPASIEAYAAPNASVKAVEIKMGTIGLITMENYKIYADVNGFKIFDGTGNILSVNDNVDSSGFNRLYLGQAAATGVTARQVEVSKNAEVSGAYGSPAGVGVVGTAQDYRSGGLRNMYTITEAEFVRVPTAFPDAGTGSVLLVYTP